MQNCEKVTAPVSTDRQVSVTLSSVPRFVLTLSLYTQIWTAAVCKDTNRRRWSDYSRLTDVPEREAGESPPSIFSSVYSLERETGTEQRRGGDKMIGKERKGKEMKTERGGRGEDLCCCSYKVSTVLKESFSQITSKQVEPISLFQSR